MELDTYRAQIDAVDAQIVALFQQRMDIAAKIAAYKRAHDLPILQSAREQEKLAAVTAQVRPELQPYLQSLYALLFDLSRRYQEVL